MPALKVEHRPEKLSFRHLSENGQGFTLQTDALGQTAAFEYAPNSNRSSPPPTP
jgi:hypothetical protein